MIGQWDQALFAEYRAAPDGPRKQSLANRLYIENEPLVKRLVSQMLGTGKRRAGQCVPAALRRLPRAEVIESWEDAMGVGGVAFAKALRDYDPKQGGIAYFLGMKIKYELQCLIGDSTNIKTTRQTRPEEIPRGFERYETEEGFERAAHVHGLEMSAEALCELVKLEYRLALARDGYALVKCEHAVFRPEA